MKRKSGFALIEVIAALPIITIVFYLGVHLIYATVRFNSAAADSADKASHVDSVIYILRADVWNSNPISADAHSVMLPDPSGNVKWTIDPDGSLTRTQSGQSRSWPAVAAHWQFSSIDAGLTITDNSPPNMREMFLVSQLMRAKRGAP